MGRTAQQHTDENRSPLPPHWAGRDGHRHLVWNAPSHPPTEGRMARVAAPLRASRTTRQTMRNGVDRSIIHRADSPLARQENRLAPILVKIDGTSEVALHAAVHAAICATTKAAIEVAIEVAIKATIASHCRGVSMRCGDVAGRLLGQGNAVVGQGGAVRYTQRSLQPDKRSLRMQGCFPIR